MKFEKLTYKNKFYILLALALLSALIIFKLSIQKSFRLYSDNSKTKEALQNVSGLPERIKKLETEIQLLDKLFGDSDENLDHRSKAISVCSKYCKQRNIRIEYIKEPHTKYQDGLIIETTEIQFEASFNKLLKLLHYMEDGAVSGKISSSEFKKIQNKRTKHERLVLKVFIQHIIKQKA